MPESALGRWPVSIQVPIAWGDMDAFDHVNNTVFLRWFESARIAYFEEIGILHRMPSDRIGPILARATCDYRLAVRYPDQVRVDATVTRLGNSSFVMSYRVHSQQQDALAAEGEAVIVLYDYATERKVALGEEVRTAIESLEAGGAG